VNDTERLDWLEKQDGGALINDDFGNWAFASDGTQEIPEDPPDDLWTAHIIEKHAWKPTVRKAIDHAIEYETQQ